MLQCVNVKFDLRAQLRLFTRGGWGMIPELAHFPANPSYGQGAYRRRLEFTTLPGAMVAQVDDSFHSYWLVLEHDQASVTGIDAGFMRAPTTVCGGAPAGLRALVGAPLASDQRALMAKLPQQSNCTHLVDLALWALAQVGRNATWQIVIPDTVDGAAWISIACDDVVVHRWQVSGFDLLAPEPLAGQPLMRGFMRWAAEAFASDALMAATMLQRGVFVARGRQHIVDRGAPVPLSHAAGMNGMCWSYSAERWASGFGSLDFVRDFSTTVRAETLPLSVRTRLKDAGR